MSEVTNIEALKNGQRVEVWWHWQGAPNKGAGKNYVPFYGTITGQNGNTIHIKFDDEDEVVGPINPFEKTAKGSDDLLIKKIVMIDEDLPKKPDAMEGLLLAVGIARDFPELLPKPKEGGKRRKKKTRKMKGGHHLYKRLGVSKYASQKQIKKAYNKLKKKKKLTKRVKYAYKILSKKKSRKKYNAKYKKMKKKKRTKRRNKGGMSSMVIKGQSFPSGFMPVFDIPDTSSLNAPAWMSQL